MAKGTDADDEKIPDHVIEKYRSRLIYLKRAQEHQRNGELTKTVENYNTYLGIMGMYLKTDPQELSPKQFDKVKDLTEMLLISHAFWDLARAYDGNPRLQADVRRCLLKFVDFSTGLKFQYVNAQMAKKFIKKSRPNNLKMFQDAYEKLRVDSGSCFIATYTFSEQHTVTNRLRQFRDRHEDNFFLDQLFTVYYTHSPSFISMIKALGPIGEFIRVFVFKPTLFATSWLLKK